MIVISTFSPQLPTSNNMVQNNLFPMMQNSQPFGSIYGNIMPQTQNTASVPNLADQWYYEDPKVSYFVFFFFRF